jgi:hypothetical protein
VRESSTTSGLPVSTTIVNGPAPLIVHSIVMRLSTKMNGTDVVAPTARGGESRRHSASVAAEDKERKRIAASSVDASSVLVRAGACHQAGIYQSRTRLGDCMQWRLGSWTPRDNLTTGLVLLIVIAVFAALYVVVCIGSYIGWGHERVAFLADPGCTTRAEAVNGRESLLLARTGCVLVAGTVVGKFEVEHRSRHLVYYDYFVDVRLGDGELREEHIVSRDFRAWNAALAGDGAMIQLYRGEVATISMETLTMHTTHNPVAETIQSAWNIVISTALFIGFVALACVVYSQRRRLSSGNS